MCTSEKEAHKKKNEHAKTYKQQTTNNKQQLKQLWMKPVASLAATSHGGDSPDSLRLLSSAVPSFYAPCSKDMEHLRMSQHKCLAPDVAMTSNTCKLLQRKEGNGI